ncbi:hypothetical protein MO973_29470 [Paenibacillus sp. TRM 82003]|uniref:hypothetical protein n=1 Tax=Kineococcus sp. TRM81007 TaxID=2925831 RepID=UPI001F5A1647|nr:hypothetical protein [Kineococcus sp. TRM81007]MCI2238939.1 hypothetical protein [Kineococcus sp. TRM81007]MCI3924358.1 hypothetical protein [Paenibacillus sp. TRM 82003]
MRGHGEREGSRHGPPGWPAPVPPPGAAGFERAAVAWLLDRAPPEHRGHPPVHRHPVVLAWLVGHHVAAQREAVRRATAGARVELAEHLPPEVVPRVLEVLEGEELRLVRLARSVDLLQRALRGEAFVPRL